LVRREEENLLAALRQETENETEAEAKLEAMMNMTDIMPHSDKPPDGFNNI